MGFQPASVLWHVAVKLFVAHFFGIKGCPNNTFNYSEFDIFLQRISPSLYGVLNRFWISLDAYRDVDNMFNTGTVLTANTFISELEEWVGNNSPK